MPWVKIDDHFDEHEKVDAISDAAFRLHISAMCFAARNLTDGDLSSHRARMLASRWTNGSELINELEMCQLWEVREDGWHIHDFEEYNTSKEKVKARRESG